jgi:hypothetical protein
VRWKQALACDYAFGSRRRACSYGATYGGSLVYDYRFNVERLEGSTAWKETELDQTPSGHGRKGMLVRKAGAECRSGAATNTASHHDTGQLPRASLSGFEHM